MKRVERVKKESEVKRVTRVKRVKREDKRLEGLREEVGVKESFRRSWLKWAGHVERIED